MCKNKKARVIAFYLPQYHPIPENDAWWGKGFTEWTNVGKAKPLFKGHYQPRVPADLGYYDLRMSEVREAQAKMAKHAGVEGFCYWHYWFGNGKQLLEQPFNNVLESKSPDFPFCLAWANHTWSSKTWLNGTRKTKDCILIKQEYPGEEEHTEHFYALLNAFKDSRYICVDGKPVFSIFDPTGIPNVKDFIDLWNRLALENGLKGIHFVGIVSNLSGFRIDDNGKKKYYLVNSSESSVSRYKTTLDLGFDAVNSRGLFRAELMAKGRLFKIVNKSIKNVFGASFVEKYDYAKIIKNLYVKQDSWNNVYPTIIPNWDRSPRSGKNAVVYIGSTPELFKKQVETAVDIVKDKPKQRKFLFLMSWNEWAEGNYMEPDLVFGNGYLNALKEVISN